MAELSRYHIRSAAEWEEHSGKFEISTDDFSASLPVQRLATGQTHGEDSKKIKSHW